MCWNHVAFGGVFADFIAYVNGKWARKRAETLTLIENEAKTSELKLSKPKLYQNLFMLAFQVSVVCDSSIFLAYCIIFLCSEIVITRSILTRICELQ